MVTDNFSSPDINVTRPMGQPCARIVYWSNGGGLSRSARIVSEALTAAGWSVELVEDVRFPASQNRVVLSVHRWRRWLRQGIERGARAVAAHAGWIEQADLNIFLEELVPSQFSLARRNVWIPNQEWMPVRWKPYLPSLDGIWVKSRYAEQLFRAHSSLSNRGRGIRAHPLRVNGSGGNCLVDRRAPHERVGHQRPRDPRHL